MGKTVKDYLANVEAHYDGTKVPDADSVFHFMISGEKGGDFTVVVKDGSCKITEGLKGSSKCEVKSTDQVFMDVMDGKMNPTMAVMGGKLKISNIGEMMKFAKPFGLI